MSAFGGIVALNRPLDAEAAEAITDIFTEVIIAPDADEEAIAIVAAEELAPPAGRDCPIRARSGLDLESVAGGFLVQIARQRAWSTTMQLEGRDEARADAQELEDLRFAWTVAKHVKSNAIVYAKGGATVGIGAGQMSRVDAARIAARKATPPSERGSARRRAARSSPRTRSSRSPTVSSPRSRPAPPR